MKTEIRTAVVSAIVAVLSFPVVAGELDLLSALETRDIESARINLNPWGAHLGFEMEIAGDDLGLAALVSVVRDAEPAQGHKCANRGAIRFRMSGEEAIAVGLLPSHSEGFYDLRLYRDERVEGVYRVRRAALLAALEELGVPKDDPAFKE